MTTPFPRTPRARRFFLRPTPDVVAALKSAFRAASEPRAVAEPLDWRTSVFPSVWRFSDGLAAYDWD